MLNLSTGQDGTVSIAQVGTRCIWFMMGRSGTRFASRQDWTVFLSWRDGSVVPACLVAVLVSVVVGGCGWSASL